MDDAVHSSTIPFPISGKHSELLLYGFIRSHFDLDLTPNDIIDLCIETYCVSYRNALNMMLSNNCCIGIYDFKLNSWRTAIYINHWDKTQRIMACYKEQDGETDRFVIIDFPCSWVIMQDPARFYVTESTLRHCSNVPTQNIDEWVIRNRSKRVNGDSTESQTVCIPRIKWNGSHRVYRQNRGSASVPFQDETDSDDSDDFVICNIWTPYIRTHTYYVVSCEWKEIFKNIESFENVKFASKYIWKWVICRSLHCICALFLHIPPLPFRGTKHFCCRPLHLFAFVCSLCFESFFSVLVLDVILLSLAWCWILFS